MAAIISAPCKDCPKHQPGCHGKCKDYAEFLEKDAAIKAQIAQQRKKLAPTASFTKRQRQLIQEGKRCVK